MAALTASQQATFNDMTQNYGMSPAQALSAMGQAGYTTVAEATSGSSSGSSSTPTSSSAASDDDTNQAIVDWLNQNPNATDAQIASQMDAAGVTPAQVAAATGVSEADIQSRYDAASSTSSSSSTSDYTLTPEKAKELTYRMMTTGVSRSEVALYGGSDAIDEMYKASGGSYSLSEVPSEMLAELANEVAATGVGNYAALEAADIPLTDEALQVLKDKGAFDGDPTNAMLNSLSIKNLPNEYKALGIQRWFEENPNATDAEIAQMMQAQGVTVDMMANATSMSTEEIQNRYNVTPVGATETLNKAYMDAFGRAPGQAAIDTYQSRIESGDYDYDSLLNELKSSDEYFVRQQYQDVLGRDVGQAGLDTYLTGLQQGTLTRDQVTEALKTSDEYLNLQNTGGTGTTTGTTTGTGTGLPSGTGGATDYALGVASGTPGYADITPSTVLTPEDARQQVATQTLDTTKDAGVTSIAQAPAAAQATAPTVTPAAQAATTTTATGVAEQAAKTAAAMGTVSPQAQVAAQVVDPRATEVAQAPQAAQIAQAQQVQAPTPLQATPEMMVSGAVDMAQVDTELAKAPAAAQATASAEATVQGQMAKLMQDFDAANPPAWASGAMRSATAALAERGLGASSMAGQAIIQAAMESALPMAQIDAQTVAQFELQNLSNRQQRAMLLAQQRADFLGQSFDQEFQARVANAAKIADIAQVNFNAATQIALENAQLAQTVDLNNLSNKQARVMAEVAQIANLEMTNLTNRQQAAVLNAQAFLQMDMANLDNLQQTTLFNSQNIIQSLFNDAAAANATAQFNATSQNQTDQFFASLASQVSQFNATQMNAINQFNADQENIVERFNAEIQNQREQFNVENQLLIDQSNAQWFREVATADTLAQNAANIQSAANMLELTTVALNNIYQQERDIMEYAWKSGENDLDRFNALAIAKLDADAKMATANITADAETSASIGKFATDVATNWSSVKTAATDIGKFFGFG